MKTDPRASITNEDFMRLFPKLGPAELARRLGVTRRVVQRRRDRLERNYHVQIPSSSVHPRPNQHPQRATIDVKNGYVLIGSDAHIWPTSGEISPALKAFMKFAKELKPAAVILNGDVLDFPQISRHPPIGHQMLPEVQDEIEAAQDVLHDIEKAAGRARKIWTLGNHDARFETRLATVAPEFRGLYGHSLKNYFPLWEPCWGAWINNEVVVKHRWKGGIHATHNNVVNGGLSMVTGHLHSAKVTPWTDYTGTRYGVDTGCLADPDHRAFVDYTEDNPKNWRAGFGVLSFRDGKMLQPQLALIEGNKIDYCGELLKL